jgi:hypothetical protein
VEIDGLYHGPGWVRRPDFRVGTHHKYEALVANAAQNNPGLTVIRLRTQREIDHWIGALASLDQGNL